MPIFQSKPIQIQALQIKARADLNSVSVFEHASEIEAFGKDFVKVFAADDLSLTVECITLNGKDLQTELNRMGNNIDDVQRTAYRGIAIALAAQQAVPNIGPGQVAVFGGVGHYEGETAGSIGVVTSFTDRISASGALGFASGSEFGGRVGVSYVFGGK